MLHRRDFCKALVIAPAAMAAPMLMRSAFADEVSSIVMVSQHGLPYLPLMVMDTLGLVQKHAGKLGIPSLKPDYKTLGGTQCRRRRRASDARCLPTKTKCPCRHRW
jgi:hypothetical protein